MFYQTPFLKSDFMIFFLNSNTFFFKNLLNTTPHFFMNIPPTGGLLLTAGKIKGKNHKTCNKQAERVFVSMKITSERKKYSKKWFAPN